MEHTFQLLIYHVICYCYSVKESANLFMSQLDVADTTIK